MKHVDIFPNTSFLIRKINVFPLDFWIDRLLQWEIVLTFSLIHQYVCQTQWHEHSLELFNFPNNWPLVSWLQLITWRYFTRLPSFTSFVLELLLWLLAVFLKLRNCWERQLLLLILGPKDLSYIRLGVPTISAEV